MIPVGALYEGVKKWGDNFKQVVIPSSEEGWPRRTNNVSLP
jgi:hypothetical protein